MDAPKIQSAPADVTAERDPTLKSLKLASLCSALWAEHGVELVVAGGSAIEILTEGAHASGDPDLCHATPAPLPTAQRKEIMARLGAKGGPRNWQVAGMHLDLPGPVESFARTPFRCVEAAQGPSSNNLYNLTGSFDGWQRCSLVTEPFGQAPRPRLASRQNSGVSW
jgi:hypothetical protein